MISQIIYTDVMILNTWKGKTKIKILHLKQGYYVRYDSVFYTLYNKDEKQIKTTANVYSFIEYTKAL